MGSDDRLADRPLLGDEGDKNSAPLPIFLTLTY